MEEIGEYAVILADLVLDSQQYYYERYEEKQDRNGKYVSANNYAESEIRAWLNQTFYNTAFNGLQQLLIQTVTVDNSLKRTGDSSNDYVCEDTNDKIYLLSYKEAKTYLTKDSARQKKSTDYAKSQGCWQKSTGSSYDGNCYWWMRSPGRNYGYSARNVDGSGSVSSFALVNYSYAGVSPALKIRLS